MSIHLSTHRGGRKPPSNKPQYNISVSRPYRNNPPGPVSNLTNHDFSSISLDDDENAPLPLLPSPLKKKLEYFERRGIVHPNRGQSSVIVRDKTYHRLVIGTEIYDGTMVRLKYKAHALGRIYRIRLLGFN